MRFLLALVVAMCVPPCYGQVTILPGDPTVDPSRIEPGISSMSFLISDRGDWGKLERSTPY